jgi:A nuclease of the HNH/ENDO VII superfamily with conserved WHH
MSHLLLIFILFCRLLVPDLGHAASMDLHSFCNGDPLNRFDPTGRFGKGNFEQGFNDLENAGKDYLGAWSAEYSDLQAGLAGAADSFGDSHYGSSINPGLHSFYSVGQGGAEVVKVLAQVGLVVATDGLGEVAEGGLLTDEALAADEGIGLETQAARSEATFTAEGQGEFGFVKNLQAAPIAEKEAAVAETGTSVAAETASSASQGEQLELSLGQTEGTAQETTSDKLSPVWNANGGVDFAGHPNLYPVSPGQRNIVSIEYTGTRPRDFGAANLKGGFGSTQRAPLGYTWHHLDDYDPISNTGTMQLIERSTHEAAYPHFGGVAQYEEAVGIPYDLDDATRATIRSAGMPLPGQ